MRLNNLDVIYQQPEDLILAVISGELSQKFTVLQQQQITLGDWCVQFHIIGESHHVCLAYQDQVVLHEVLACTTLDEVTCQHHHAFHRVKAHRYAQPGYNVTVQFMQTAPAEPTLPPANWLDVRFPTVYGLEPYTRLGWQMDTDRLHWWTVHVYPTADHVTYVTTQSYFCPATYLIISPEEQSHVA